jgi:hypothetical protein
VRPPRSLQLPPAAPARRRVEQHLAQPVESGGCAAVSTGFYIYNLTTTTMTLQSIADDNNWEGHPDVGSVLPPAQSADFEVQFR